MGKRRHGNRYEYKGFALGWRGAVAVAEYSDSQTGKRVRVRLGTARNQAEGRTLLERYANAHSAVDMQSREPTVGDLWRAWLSDRLRDGLDNTIYAYNWRVMEPAFGHRIATTITADECRNYASARFAAGRRPATVHTELSRLRHCLRWAEARRLIDRAPYVWVPQPGKSRSLVVSPEEMMRLIEGARAPHVHLFIVLAISTGARHRAILELTWDRVDFVRGTVSYEGEEMRDPMSKSWRKGRATVLMNRTLRSALENAYPGRQSNYVVEHGGKPLKSIKDGFKAAVLRAGLDPKVTPHTIRHSVATMARARGADLEKVAHMLGHTDSATTRLIYSHLDAGYSAEVVDLIDIGRGNESDDN